MRFSSAKESPSVSWWHIRRLWCVLFAGYCLRGALYFGGWHTTLRNVPPFSMLLSTPINSYLSLQEGYFLYKNALSPYSGDIYHQPPLLILPLHFCSLAGNASTFYFHFLFLIDCCTACILVNIIRTITFRKDKMAFLKGVSIRDPIFLASLYFVHPFTISANAALSNHNIVHCTIAFAILAALRSDKLYWRSCFASSIAMLAYLSPLELPIYGVSLIFLSFSYRNKYFLADPSISVLLRIFFKSLFWLFVCVFSSVILYVASYVLMDYSWDFIDGCYLFQVEMRDLTPNVGLHWYINTLVLADYWILFRFVLLINTVFHALPLFLKLYNAPFVYSLICIAMALLFQSYPTVADSSFLLFLCNTFSGLKFDGILAKLVIASTTCVGFIAISIKDWLISNTWNANPAFSMMMAYQVVTSGLILALFYSVLHALKSTKDQTPSFDKKVN
ncbi:GPI transamidase subunit PIG-U protein [Cardiosporidium cionae]|uniref:GPI transamidase subunit PIG-U protein n=1 Tax=Cardiosporidium cionae TaxID=476202 RepID=A0ABQ7JB95_9APIC|nr:GPI transamidase subunit PIG-U protein [Cardiosporidium cionae]|eukprot:KAF8821220.1 GPI transamidase subunit PIG-U protein [Cardiosporidium cionae]